MEPETILNPNGRSACPLKTATASKNLMTPIWNFFEEENTYLYSSFPTKQSLLPNLYCVHEAEESSFSPTRRCAAVIVVALSADPCAML